MSKSHDRYLEIGMYAKIPLPSVTYKEGHPLAEVIHIHGNHVDAKRTFDNVVVKARIPGRMLKARAGHAWIQQGSLVLLEDWNTPTDIYYGYKLHEAAHLMKKGFVSIVKKALSPKRGTEIEFAEEDIPLKNSPLRRKSPVSPLRQYK